MSTLTSTSTTLHSQHSNKSAQLVLQLRHRFLEDYENNRDLYDEQDMDRIRQNDWYVKRFLLARARRVDDAYDMLRDAMRWRKEFGLSAMKDSDFPLEFYKAGGLFPYETDLNGNVVIYMRIRMHRKTVELADPMKKFLMHIVNRVDIETDGNGAVIVFDCSDAGYSNMDLEFLKFLITAANSYFPVGLKYILIYELSWVLSAFRKIAMSLIPQRLLPLIKFANKTDIFDFISKENLPDFMGGTCRKNYRQIPKGCTTVEQLALQHGYTEDDVKRLLPLYKPLLDEADAMLATGNYDFSSDFDDNDNIDNNGNNDESETVIANQLIEFDASNAHLNGKVLGLFPNDFVQLTFVSSINAYQASVLLQNLSNFVIAFKVQSNNPNNYYVSPRFGILLENATIKFNIHLISHNKYKKNDKFLILALPIQNAKISSNDFLEIWKNGKKNIFSYKLLSRIHPESNNLSKIVDKRQCDVNTEIASLRDWCYQLEASQRRLSLLLNVMLVMIVFLLCLIIYSHSSSGIPSLSLKLETLRNVSKNFLSNN